MELRLLTLLFFLGLNISVLGQVEASYKFNGDSNHVSIPDSSIYDFQNTDFSIEFEIQMAVNQENSTNYIFSKVDNSSGIGISIGTSSEPGYYQNLFFEMNEVRFFVSDIDSLWDNEKHRISLTYVSSNEDLYIHFDDVPFSSVIELPNSPTNNNADIILGQPNIIGNNGFTGIIKDVRIWKKSIGIGESIGENPGFTNNNDPDLIGNWRLNETNGYFAIDNSTVQNHAFLGTKLNPEKFRNPGRFSSGHYTDSLGYCNELDFSDHYVTIPNHPDYNFGLGDFTVEAIIKPDVHQPSYPIVYSHRDNPINSGLLLGLEIDDLFYTRVVTENKSGGLPNTYHLNDGQYHHIALSRHAYIGESDTLFFYIDGILVYQNGASNVSEEDINVSSDLIIGNDFISPSVTNWNGIIKEVRIWNKKRSYEEINETLYKPLEGTENGLVGYFKLDDTTQLIKDHSSNQNNGYLGSSINIDINDPLLLNNALCDIPQIELSINNEEVCVDDTVSIIAIGDPEGYNWYINSIDTTFSILDTNEIKIILESDWDYKIVGMSGDSILGSITVSPCDLKLNLEHDTICTGDEVTLIGYDDLGYSWKNTSLTPNQIISDLDTFSLVLDNTTNFQLEGESGDKIDFTITTLSCIPELQLSKNIFCDGDTIIARASNDFSYSWYILPDTNNTISVSDSLIFQPTDVTNLLLKGISGESIEFTVSPINQFICNGPESLIIYDYITPNNDGFNDYFFIEGIENYPNNKIMIVDQWGNLIKSLESYTNDWSPINITPGIYYYKLTINGSTTHSGGLYISQ